MSIPAEIAAILPDLTNKILSCGENIAQIILHGSATEKTQFSPGSSDVDIVIIVTGSVSLIRQVCIRSYAETLDGTWTKVGITFLLLERIERLKNFELCYEGRVSRGLILYDANHISTHPTLSRDEARNEVSNHYMERAWWWLSSTMPDDKRTTWSACRAACSAFHSILIRHDTDIAPKYLRWNLPSLFAAAIEHYPSLAKLAPHIETLPVDIAGMDVADFCDTTEDWDELENMHRMAAAIRIAKVCGKIIGSKPAYYSRRRRIRNLRLERLQEKIS
jgi:predicted nucleotidyltransferase